jgi:hypothetical protein
MLTQRHDRAHHPERMGYSSAGNCRSRGTQSQGEVFVHRRTLQLSLVPAASLAVLALAGCGGTADAADTPPAPVTVTVTQSTVRTTTTTATPPATTITSTMTQAPVTSTVTTTSTAAAGVGAGAGAGAGADVDVQAPQADPAPAPQPLVASPPSSSYFKNCSEAKAAGAAPLYAGEPGYRSALDRDNDGVACET